MTSDEGMMIAAGVMRDAAEMNQRAAARMEDAAYRMKVLFAEEYDGTAPRLLEELVKFNAAGEVLKDTLAVKDATIAELTTRCGILMTELAEEARERKNAEQANFEQAKSSDANP